MRINGDMRYGGLTEHAGRPTVRAKLSLCQCAASQ
jgi:hypothetical protein